MAKQHTTAQRVKQTNKKSKKSSVCDHVLYILNEQEETMKTGEEYLEFRGG